MSGARRQASTTRRPTIVCSALDFRLLAVDVRCLVHPASGVRRSSPGHHQAIGGSAGGGGGDPHLLPPVEPVQPRPEGSMAAVGAARPASMSDRARLAKVPQPEPGLKCPRCESTNTKFCYFNNYSLSQPRHFCKTCRRYWTRGGALRNVPVGGGCRRNKRSKSGGGSKSSAASADRQASTSASSVTSGAAGVSAIASSIISPHPQLPFMASLHSMADYGAPGASIGLGFGGAHHIDAGNFHVGGSSGAGLEQWRLQQQVQQFPFLSGLEPPAAPPSLGLFPFNAQGVMDGGAGGFAAQVHGKPSVAAALNSHLGSVKNEEEPERLNLPRQYLGIARNDHFWGGGGNGSTGGGSGSGTGGSWTDISGFNSTSSCSNIL
ncbi:hypothetical protein Taro_040036 [Colocasia esculenta]|uniref:Dof zinc finger protein n=1 Tax=Colocasia esculenta TaxID=4460 RepID=A0A843W7Y0_COLES|nr:hypothetical protein [Colocasia esculenta]